MSIPPTQADHSDYAAALLSHAREELRFADAKASALFTVIGVVVGLTTGLAAASTWSPNDLTTPSKALTFLTAASLLLSSLLSAAAIYPRVGLTVREPVDRVAYFGDVARFRTAVDLQEALRRTVEVRYDVLAEELLAVSHIALIKYRLITGSLWLMLTAAIFGSSAFIFQV